MHVPPAETGNRTHHHLRDPDRPLRRHLPLALLLVWFLASRLGLYAAGVRFDASGLDRYWQFLPSALLRTDLLRSLWDLHAQPPLFNAFLGLGLQTAPALVFPLTFLGLSLAMHVALWRSLQALGVGPGPALAVLLVWSLNPSLATHENWLFYALWEAGLLLLAARAVQRDQPLRWAAWLSLLMLTRAAFHPLWLLGVLLLYAVSCWRKGARPDRRVLVAALLPLVLTGAWMCKNQLRFGEASTSSWLGMNVARATVSAAAPEWLEPALARGALSPVARIGPFQPLAAYDHVLPPTPLTGHPALDGNHFNNLRYVAVAHALRADALTVLRERPEDYATRVADGAAIFLQDTNHNAQLWQNRRPLAALDDLYNAVLRPGGSLLPMALLLLAALGVGVAALWSRRRRTRLASNDLLAAFLTGSVLWLVLAGTLLEYGENNRFRFAIDPLLLLLLAAGGQHLAADGLVGVRRACVDRLRRARLRLSDGTSRRSP